jgi:hypothetical protein
MTFISEFCGNPFVLLSWPDIKKWLTTIGAPQLWGIFETNEIDLQALLLCNREDWEKMGISKKGPLQKIALATDAVRDLEASLQAEGRLKDRQMPTIRGRFRVIKRVNFSAIGSVMLSQDLEMMAKSVCIFDYFFDAFSFFF